MQHINLYHAEFRTAANHKKIVMIVAACLVLLVFIGIYMMQLNAISQLDRQLAKKLAELKTMEVSVAALEEKAKPRAQDMNLVVELERLKQANASKLRASNYLRGNDTGNIQGFSTLLKGLGRQRDTINELWLTKIEISQGGFDMRLTGKNHQAKLLPQFIEALSNEPLYKDREFMQMKINRSDSSNNILEFVLDTRHTESVVDDADRYRSKKHFMAKLKALSEQPVDGSLADQVLDSKIRIEEP